MKKFRRNNSKESDFRRTSEIKRHARRTLHQPVSSNAIVYVIDTSIVANKFVTRLVRTGKVKGKIIIPNAVMAELEN